MSIPNEVQPESRSLAIYNEALHKIQDYCFKQLTNEDYISNIWKLISRQFFLKKLGFYIVPSKMLGKIRAKYIFEDAGKYASIGTTFDILTNSSKLDEVYQLLYDQTSKETLDWLIKYRFGYAFLGNMAGNIFPYTINNSGKKYSIKRRGAFFQINNYLLESTNYEIENTWMREQYALDEKCEPQKGDIVVSAGAYLGETSIWLADKVGASGQVYAFEPTNKFLKKLNENIRRNKLSEIIKVINNGLWNENTSILNTTVVPDLQFNTNDNINVISLDSFVDSNNIPRIDFIKMDIEGAELKALMGAEKTIKKYKPKLAICVYHSPDDIVTIPKYLKSLVPEYKLYLSHKNPWWAETVLFGSVN